ncbi:alpha/beta fold hydrolase [Rhizobium sp. Leaf341]|uniref:alpha/beta fold hydrolase n=1 Tax=Rhizobium sp. Leaf341 TaxID=1736344 RepID=UPI00071354EB|nr:alpha/beta hydrolase [Rhizobium sp. Leaf341]KQR69936.1 hypothetical protein ASG03_04530 [Rhizobium sp. Leaf341]
MAFACLMFGASHVDAATATCGESIDTKCGIELPNGMSLSYLDIGPKGGRTIVLLHGLTDSVLTWLPTIEALRALDPTLRIVALDQRGHGGSGMPAGKDCPNAPKTCFAIKQFAQDAIDLMDALGISKAAVVGPSMGSFITQQIALDFPDRIDAATLVSTGGSLKGNTMLASRQGQPTRRHTTSCRAAWPGRSLLSRRTDSTPRRTLRRDVSKHSSAGCRRAKGRTLRRP